MDLKTRRPSFYIGKIPKENLEHLNLEEDFIFRILRKEDVKKIKDVLIMTLDNNGEVFIQSKKSSNYKNFKMNYDGGGKW